MWFKNLTRRLGHTSHFIGKQINHGATFLQSADHFLGKQIRNIHSDYRKGKRYLIKHDPTHLGLVKAGFNELENHTPAGIAVDKARKTALGLLNEGDKFLGVVGQESAALRDGGFSKANYNLVRDAIPDSRLRAFSKK
jgi:hypothetical protein